MKIINAFQALFICQALIWRIVSSSSLLQYQRYIETVDGTQDRASSLFSDFDETGSILNVNYDRASAKFLLNLYKNLRQGQTLPEASGHDRTDKVLMEADTVRSFSALTGGRSKARRPWEFPFLFNITSLPTTENLRLVELRVFSKSLLSTGSSAPKDNYRLKITIEQDNTLLFKSKQKIDHTRITTDGFVVFDVTDIIEKSLTTLKGSMLVKLTLRDKKQIYTRSSNLRKNDNILNNDDDAIIVMFSEDHDFLKKYKQAQEQQHHADLLGRFKRGVKRHKTKRRKHGEKKKNRTYKHDKNLKCSKHDFYVDFDEIGWGKWIVYPKRFNAHFCIGKCPSPVDQHLNPTNHAVMQSLMRLKNPSSVPEPCCVPTKLSALSMLYYEYDEIVVRHHEDMVVDECGCR